MNVTILIPAYNPDGRLLEMVAGLQAIGFGRILVVDDGSAARCQPLFDQLQARPGCRLLRHAVNLGKGRALKTGFNHFLLQGEGDAGVVTADADGQHRPEDVRKVAAELVAHPGDLVIGCRRLSGRVPLRSRFGNGLTRRVFTLLTGTRLADTQSGLRGIPRRFIPRLVGLRGDRYEYEMNMLLAARPAGVPIRQTDIETIYIDDNRSSHFHPLLDSMKIYFLLFRFLFSSLLSALVDFVVFSGLHLLGVELAPAIITARAVSGGINFLLNKRVVFRDRDHWLPEFVKFWALLVSRGALSLFLIHALVSRAGFPVVPAYLLVESSLFLVSFAVQREFVFPRAGAEE